MRRNLGNGFARGITAVWITCRFGTEVLGSWLIGANFLANQAFFGRPPARVPIPGWLNSGKGVDRSSTPCAASPRNPADKRAAHSRRSGVGQRRNCKSHQS